MPTLIKIVRDRDQTVLEQDLADVSDGTSLGQAISNLIARIVKAHPQTELRNFTIKVGSDAGTFA